MEKTRKQWWLKYSPDFKRTAVDRFLAGESSSALARELNIRRKFLYQWRDKGFGSAAAEDDRRRGDSEANKVDLQQQQLQGQKIKAQQQKIAELERLLGRQAAELDFFAAALRATKDLRHNRDESSASGSTRRSKA